MASRTSPPSVARLIDVGRTLASALMPLAAPLTPEDFAPGGQHEQQDESVFDLVVRHSDLRRATSALFHGQHYTQAVEQGCKELSALVRKKSGLTEDGTDLMEKAFAPPASPRLRVNGLKTEADKKEQIGYHQMFKAVTLGIRNLRAHTADDTDGEVEALQLLGMLDYLFHVADRSTRTRRRAKP